MKKFSNCFRITFQIAYYPEVINGKSQEKKLYNQLVMRKTIMEPCPVCGEPTTFFPGVGTRDVYEVTCHNRCGEYVITRKALVNLRNTQLSLGKVGNISGWLRENPHYEIDSRNIDNLLQLKSPSFHEKAEKLLLAFEKMTLYAGDTIKKESKLISLGWCANQDEFNEIIIFFKNHTAHP